MDNRGSKSAKGKLMVVKEQRVYGSGQVNDLIACLRCTLKGIRKDTQINIHSKQINKRLFTSIRLSSNMGNEASTINIAGKSYASEMDPHFFTGFSDGEASFILYIQKSHDTKIG